MMKFNDLDDVFKYLDKINNPDDLQYYDCKQHSYLNIEDYELILQEVLKNKPKRVIDVGSNLNQYGFLFANQGIEYIGVEVCLNKGWNPVETDNIKFIHKDFNKIKDQFKNDVIISVLCVGYLVDENIECKKLITNKMLKR